MRGHILIIVTGHFILFSSKLVTRIEHDDDDLKLMVFPVFVFSIIVE